jgi:hypothetical protein
MHTDGGDGSSANLRRGRRQALRQMRTIAVVVNPPGIAQLSNGELAAGNLVALR